MRPILKILDSSRFSRTVARFFSTALSWRSISWIWLRTLRRLSSSWLSPGPREPIPPAWRLSIIPCPTKRGSRYLSWARCTCSLPSWLLALMAKISKISCIRSMTLTPKLSSRLTFWRGVRRLLTMTVEISSASTSCRISSNLPEPTKVLLSYFSRFWL